VHAYNIRIELTVLSYSVSSVKIYYTRHFFIRGIRELCIHETYFFNL